MLDRASSLGSLGVVPRYPLGSQVSHLPLEEARSPLEARSVERIQALGGRELSSANRQPQPVAGHRIDESRRIACEE